MTRPQPLHLVMSREHLLAKLNDQLKIGQAIDKKALAAHHQAELELHKLFKAHLRDALKWDLATAKKQYFQVGVDYDTRRRASCPLSVARRFSAAIESIALDDRSTYRMSPGSTLHDLITWAPVVDDGTVC